MTDELEVPAPAPVKKKKRRYTKTSIKIKVGNKTYGGTSVAASFPVLILQTKVGVTYLNLETGLATEVTGWSPTAEIGTVTPGVPRVSGGAAAFNVARNRNIEGLLRMPPGLPEVDQ